MLQKTNYQQLHAPEHPSTFPHQQQQPEYLVKKMYAPHPISQIPQGMPIYQNVQQQQILQNQFVPAQNSSLLIQNQYIEAEHQIQQEIQNLQQLQSQLKYRQQQFVSNLNTQTIPVHNNIHPSIQILNQNSLNNNYLQTQFPNQPTLINQLQNATTLNIQNNFTSYPKVLVNPETVDAAYGMIHPNQHHQQLMMNNEISRQQQLQKYQMMPQQAMFYGENPHLNSMISQQQIRQDQLNLNKKRNMDMNLYLSKIEESTETLSPETLNMQINKKICTEELKSSSTLVDSNNSIQNSQKQVIKGSPQTIISNSIQKQIISPNLINNNISLKQTSPIQQQQQYRNNLNTSGLMNNFSLDHSFQSNTIPVNTYLNMKKEQKPQFREKIEDQQQQQQDQNSSENNDGDKRCKKEIQNDSNYTKNLLKGFRRHMSKKYKDNKENNDKFQQYFYNNTLSNEFVLILLENSPYQTEFDEFLQEDPTWWIKEAKIKEPKRQLKFFETVKSKNYTDIRTKKKVKSSSQQNLNCTQEISSTNNNNNTQPAPAQN